MSNVNKREKFLEQHTKHELQDLYLGQNLNMEDLCNMFGVSYYVLSNALRHYGISKDLDKRLQKRAETKEKLYGDPNYVGQDKRKLTLESRTEEQKKAYSDRCKEVWKNRSTEEKEKITLKRKQTRAAWSKEYRSEIFRKATLNSIKSGTGYKNRKQAVQTRRSRYGTKYYSVQKSKDTRNRKYGGYGNNCKQAQETCIKRYGVALPGLIASLKSKNSKPNLNFASLLQSRGIAFDREISVGKYVYDFKVGNILIEINPSATHNSTWGVRGRSGVSSEYHLCKYRNAVEFGYECAFVFDWDDPNLLVNYILAGKVPRSSGNVRRHFYNLKTKQHLMPESDVEKVPEGFVEIFDAGEVSYIKR